MKGLEQLVEMFPKLLQQFAKELQTAWQVSISAQFRDKDDEFFNNSSKLRGTRGSKGLRADLSKATKIDIKDGKVELKYGTDKPYAGIQNRGGFIYARRTHRTNKKTGKQTQTYKMAQYFWAKYYESKASAKGNVFRIMALSVEKKGGVKIKGKFYLARSIKDFEERSLQRVVESFFNQILRIWNVN